MFILGSSFGVDKAASHAALSHAVECMQGSGEFASHSGQRFAFASDASLHIWPLPDEARASGGVVACFQGILFNSAELVGSLALSPDSSLAEIACNAYLRHGELFPEKLDGEFSFAIWDGPAGKLILGRDAIGREPIFYAQAGGSWTFATELRAFNGWPGVDTRLNEEWVARFLCLEIKPGQTLLRGVSILLPGNVVVLKAGGSPRQIAYWQPLRIPEFRPRDPAEYAEGIREGLRRAVAVRLPPDGIVACQLSSGLDSSSVTSFAAAALAARGKRLLAYTSSPSVAVDALERKADRFGDEWPLASAVASKYPNIYHIRVSTDAATWWEALDTLADNCGAPGTSIRSSRWYYAIYRDAARRGATMMLEGQFGNLVGSYSGGLGPWHLRAHGRWLELIRFLAARRRLGAGWSSLVNDTFLPPSWLYGLVRRLRSKPRLSFADMSLLRPEFRLRARLPRLRTSPYGIARRLGEDGRASRLAIMRMADTGMMQTGIQRAFGVRRVDPTSDRRLIEFCLSIPDDAFAPKGVPRDLYRQAMAGILPDALLQERARGLQSSDFLETFERAIPEFLDEADALADFSLTAGILDVHRLKRMLKEFPPLRPGNKALLDTRYDYTVGGALCFGRFLRQHFSSDGRML